MAEQGDVCPLCERPYMGEGQCCPRFSHSELRHDIYGKHSCLTYAHERLKAKLAQAMKVVEAAYEMRSWYRKQMGPDGPEESFDTELAKLKELP